MSTEHRIRFDIAMPIERLTTDQIMLRLKQVRIQAEQTQSLEPIALFFDNLAAYARRVNPNQIGLDNWARTMQLWQTHMEPWYLKFREGKR